jgi:hypothetical protein
LLHSDCLLSSLRRVAFVSAWISLWLTPSLNAQTSSLGASTLTSTTSSTTTTSTPVTVSGQVVSATSGTPVFRALVHLNERAVLTDHEGKFEFPEFTPAQTNHLQVSKPGFYPSIDATDSGAVSLRSDQLAQMVELRLYPEALLTGTVTRPDGTPLSHIAVSARRSIYGDQGHRWMPVGHTQTDSHGNFRLAVPPGDYRLQTEYSPHSGATAEAVLPLSLPSDTAGDTSDLIHAGSGSAQHFDLRPTMSRTYGVTIEMNSGQDRGFPMMTAHSSNGLTIPLGGAGRPAGPGEMRVELPAGTYTLIATQNGPDSIQSGQATVTVTDHDVTGVSMRLSAVTPIPVELAVDTDATSDKTPPTLQQFGLTLEALQTSGEQESPSVGLMSIRDQGLSFRASPGIYHLNARSSGTWYVKNASYGTTDILDKDLTVEAGAGGEAIRLTVSDQSGSLAGTTTLNGTLAACWLYLVPTTPSATSVFSVHSNSDGTYTFAYLPPGSYRAIAFEARHSANYRDPETLNKFATYVSSITISAGNKSSLDISAISQKDLTP